jgi:endonuclease/exonuclease/phosphatase family metal-dependent hydrolase
MNSSRSLKILSYNTHVGIKASNKSESWRNIWQHVLPSQDRIRILEKISDIISSFDVVGLQESDAGSLRSNFMNHTKHLAHLGGFKYWTEQVNRNLIFARHSMGFLSRYKILSVARHPLPGKIPGRGLLVVHLTFGDEPIVFAISHLSLGPRDRIKQANYIGDIIREMNCSVILMGDFNCGSDSKEISVIMNKTGLTPAIKNIPTYPSWRPERDIDHFLVSRGIIIKRASVMGLALSDHLPFAIEAVIPRKNGNRGQVKTPAPEDRTIKK